MLRKQIRDRKTNSVYLLSAFMLAKQRPALAKHDTTGVAAWMRTYIVSRTIPRAFTKYEKALVNRIGTRNHGGYTQRANRITFCTVAHGGLNLGICRSMIPPNVLRFIYRAYQPLLLSEAAKTRIDAMRVGAGFFLVRGRKRGPDQSSRTSKISTENRGTWSVFAARPWIKASRLSTVLTTAGQALIERPTTHL